MRHFVRSTELMADAAASLSKDAAGVDSLGAGAGAGAGFADGFFFGAAAALSTDPMNATAVSAPIEKRNRVRRLMLERAAMRVPRMCNVHESTRAGSMRGCGRR